MQYIIFSDIHGNLEALKVLLDIENPEMKKRFIFCGDVCGYYYQAKECSDLLQDINGLIAVRGNHDQYYLDAYDDTARTKELVEKYGSSYMDKYEDVRTYIESLPKRAEIHCGEMVIHIQHGTPIELLEGRLYPDTPLPKGEPGHIYITGHTHYRMLKEERNSIWINPGSLGQPRDGKGFSYCVLDDETLDVSFRNVNVNIEKLVQEVRLRDPENKYLGEVLYRSL